MKFWRFIWKFIGIILFVAVLFGGYVAKPLESIQAYKLQKNGVLTTAKVLSFHVVEQQNRGGVSYTYYPEFAYNADGVERLATSPIFYYTNEPDIIGDYAKIYYNPNNTTQIVLAEQNTLELTYIWISCIIIAVIYVIAGIINKKRKTTLNNLINHV